MIVRILGEGQFEVADEHRPALDKLDDALLKAVDANDEAAFGPALGALADEVRRVGQPVASDTFIPSDLVVPFSDATLDEWERISAEAAADEG